MSDTIVIIAVVFVVLLLVSFMLAARLQAAGAAARRTSALIAKLWLTVGVVVTLLMAMSRVLGLPSGRVGVEGELRDIAASLKALSAQSKWLFGAGAVLALALVAHLMYVINKATRAAAPPS